jgi:multicomponent Na+:H+ antiporter subunit D
MILAVFPFYSWMPMLSESAPPYSYGFVCFVLASLISFLLLDYLQRYMSLGVSEYLVTSYRLAGVVMVVIGGTWAVFEKHLGRILGFATMVQIGTSLMIISMMNGNEPVGAFSGPFFYHLMAFGISLALWSFALNVINNQTANPTLTESQGQARRTPVAALGLVLANFSMAGLPLLASFPVYISLWSALAQKFSAYAILSFLGSACLLIAGLRTLAVFAGSQGDQAWKLTERGFQFILILAAAAMLLLLGLMPQWFFRILANIGPNLTVISP